MRLRFPPIDQPGVIYDGYSPYRRLALAVILRAMADLDTCDPETEEYISAHEWLFGDEDAPLTLEQCCYINSLDPEHVREHLTKSNRKRYRVREKQANQA